jgi:hypothetical protein
MGKDKVKTYDKLYEIEKLVRIVEEKGTTVYIEVKNMW